MIRLGWMHYDMGRTDPVARGFFTTAFHIYAGLKTARNLEIVDLYPANAYKKHIRRLGLDSIFHFCPPHRFTPVDWAKNHLFTMWEAPLLTPEIEAALKAANGALMVPSRYNRDTFAAHAGVQGVAIPLGVSRAFMETNPERSPIVGGGTRRRFLYVGSKNPRKGFAWIPEAVRQAFKGRQAEVQVYIKTVADPGEPQEISYPFGDDRLIMDTRDLEIRELAEVYQAADIFFFPSFGEGFGLPPLEAMACGCLVVSSQAGALSEYIGPSTAVIMTPDTQIPINYGVEWIQEVASPNSIAFSLRAALDRWGTPGAEAVRRHATKVARQYHWEKTAAGVLSVISGQPVAVPQELSHEENQILRATG